MKRTALLAALALCLQVEGKPVPKAPDKAPPKDDLKSLQGEWEMVSLEQRGQQAPATYRLTINGDKWLVGSVNGEAGAGASITFKIDQSKTPKAIDLTAKLGGEERMDQAIYKLEGDIFTVCRDWKAIVRPTEFKTTEEGGTLAVWKRVSPKGK